MRNLTAAPRTGPRTTDVFRARGHHRSIPSRQRAFASTMRKPGSENAPIPPHRSTKNRLPFAGICVSALIRKPQVIGCRVIDVIAPGPEPEWEEIESGFGASSPGTSKNVAAGVRTKGMCTARAPAPRGESFRPCPPPRQARRSGPRIGQSGLP
jgi:hypothetical protein